MIRPWHSWNYSTYISLGLILWVYAFVLTCNKDSPPQTLLKIMFFFESPWQIRATVGVITSNNFQLEIECSSVQLSLRLWIPLKRDRDKIWSYTSKLYKTNYSCLHRVYLLWRQSIVNHILERGSWFSGVIPRELVVVTDCWELLREWKTLSQME